MLKVRPDRSTRHGPLAVRRLLRGNTLAVVTTLASGLGLTLHAQSSSLTVSVSPMVSFGSHASVLREIEFGGAPRVGTQVDAHLAFGFHANVRSAAIPLQVRAGWSRTIGSNVKVPTGGVTKRSIGDAAISNLWGDVLLSPFDWSVRPYGFLGLTRRRVGYADEVLRTSPAFPKADVLTATRRGLGVHFDKIGNGVWVEVLTQSGGDHFDPDAGDASAFRQQSDVVFSIGFAIPIFGDG